METKLLVKNEHGQFEIEVGDKVEMNPDCFVVKSFNSEHQIFIEPLSIVMGLYGLEYMDGSYISTFNITGVRKRIEWINGLGKNEVAWEGDNCYEVLGGMQVKCINVGNVFHNCFVKLEDAREYMARKIQFLDRVIETPCSDFDKKYEEFIQGLNKIICGDKKPIEVPEDTPFTINGLEYKWKNVDGTGIIYQNHK